MPRDFIASTELHFKDAVLNTIADQCNVAQFVSFAPDHRQRFCRITGIEPNHVFAKASDAVSALLSQTADGAVNIRSYQPENPKSNEFLRCLRSVGEVESALIKLGSSGLFTIVNENIDVNDGGVSGVLLNGVVEFAPGDTPRCVERADVAVLDVDQAVKLFKSVYRMQAQLTFPADLRVEFSVHPFPQGFLKQRIVFWEQQANTGRIDAILKWPNAFSRWIGDKAFGLLIADLLGFKVPKTVVLPRRLPLFEFGSSTNSSMVWVRTAPREKTPGAFSTVRGWADPFQMMHEEDPDGTLISSVLVQEEVKSIYSGALLTAPNGEAIIEGVHGFGDKLMLGQVRPTILPADIKRRLQDIHMEAMQAIGSLRMEWGFDGENVWILQLQQELSSTNGDVIYPGDVANWEEFEVHDGVTALTGLRQAIKELPENSGILLIGKFGMTSHLADVLRDNKVPSRRVPPRRLLPRQLSLIGDPDVSQ